MSGPILAIDTATSRVVVGVASPDGEPLGVQAWPAEHRHGEQLLVSIGRLLDETAVTKAQLRGIVVGIGPGAFTGLRVGLATAKALARGLGCPIAGIPTSEALIDAAAADARVPASDIVLLLPAGPNDRVLARLGGQPERLVGRIEPDLRDGDLLVAVDLDGRAPDEAVQRGARALEGLGPTLLRLGAARLGRGGDDLERLVPEYVTLPRGVAAAAGEVSWLRDHR